MVHLAVLLLWLTSSVTIELLFYQLSEAQLNITSIIAALYIPKHLGIFLFLGEY